MKITLLGAGRIGHLHARLLRELPEVDELVIADADATRAAQLAHDVGAAHIASVEQAVAEADALVIAAATNAHAGLVRAGVDRGIPVFRTCCRSSSSSVDRPGQRRSDPRPAQRRTAAGMVPTAVVRCASALADRSP